MYFYGYKSHAVCSASRVFSNIKLTPACVHDIHYLKNVKYNLSSCTLIENKGYLSADYQLDLFNSSQIQLEVPMRINQHNYKKQPYLLKKNKETY